MSSGEESNREEELTIVNLENVKRISETYKPQKGKNKSKRGIIPKIVVQEVWKDRLSPRFYSRLMSVMFPEECNEVSFLSFYTIYKNLAEPDTEIMFRALTIYHIATIHEPPFNYEQANEYPNAPYKAIKDYVCDVITSYLHATIHFNMKEAHAWLDLRASNTLIDGNLVASYMLKDLETHRNEVSIGSLEIWLEKNEMYYTVSEQLFLYLFGVNTYSKVKPLIPFPVVQTGGSTKTLLALPDVLLLNSKLPKRSHRWTLAYMLDSRTQNWETLKQAIYGKGPTIIVIQDANGDIFGLYGSQRWFPAGGFFGNGECFLFTLKPDVNIYEGSGRDRNFQLFTESGIGMGGTADQQGLFIQSNAVKGTTSLACSTFREFWPLARELEFKITHVEIWVVEDEHAQIAAEQEIQELISNTQYKESNEIFNETNTMEQPKNQQQGGPIPVKETTPTEPKTIMREPQKCYGACAKGYQSRNRTNESSEKVCCSKSCGKKNGAFPKNRSFSHGEGDANAKIHYPPQAEERLQRQQTNSEDKDGIKRVKKYRRISFNACQKHGRAYAAGFIHPSLAAEENARNAREAKKAKELALSSIESKPNKPKTSLKNELSVDRDFREKSKVCTFTNNQTQVGASRLMKKSCRSYNHENKCACQVNKVCACSPRESLKRLKNGNEGIHMMKVNHVMNEVASEGPIETCRLKTKEGTGEVQINRNEFQPHKTSETSHTIHEPDHDDVRTQECNISANQSCPTNDILIGSSSSALIEVINSGSLASRSHASTPKSARSKVPPGTEKLEQKLDKSAIRDRGEKSAHFNVEGYNKIENIHAPGVPSDNSGNPGSNAMRSKEESKNVSLQDLKQAELDCHCSPSIDCNEEGGVKNSDLALMCCCDTKVSTYMTKMNRTNTNGITLSEISSSVCSCIFDNKDKATTSSGLSYIASDKTKNHSKLKRKSNESFQSAPLSRGQTKMYINSKKIATRAPESCISYKKETELHTRRANRKSASSHSDGRPVPPTCLQCKTLVSQHGCQCKAKSVEIGEGASKSLQTSHHVHKESGNNSLPHKRSVVIETEVMSIISNPKIDPESVTLLSESVTLSDRNSEGGSSQYSQTKEALIKSCKTACKCSLSPTYFPVFPEDLIKEGGTEDNCDCASYNDLRFPIIEDTPPVLSPEISNDKIGTPEEPNEVDKQEEEQTKHKPCGCDDNENTIIILNVSKCNTAETVEKIVHDLEVNAGDGFNPNTKGLVFRGEDLAKQVYVCTQRPVLTKREKNSRSTEKNIDKEEPTQAEHKQQPHDEN